MDILTFTLVLIVANLVIGPVCRLAAPRAWGRWLCWAAILVTALPVLVVLKVILDLATHRVDGMAGIVVLPGLLLLVELLWLVKVYQDCYRRRELPPS